MVSECVSFMQALENARVYIVLRMQKVRANFVFTMVEEYPVDNLVAKVQLMDLHHFARSMVEALNNASMMVATKQQEAEVLYVQDMEVEEGASMRIVRMEQED